MTTTQPETHRVYPDGWAHRFLPAQVDDSGDDAVPFGDERAARRWAGHAARHTGAEMEVFYVDDIDGAGGAWCYRPALLEGVPAPCAGALQPLITKPPLAMAAHVALAEAGIDMQLHEVVDSAGHTLGYCLHPADADTPGPDVRQGCAGGARTRDQTVIDRAITAGRYVHPVVPHVLTWQCIHHPAGHVTGAT